KLEELDGPSPRDPALRVKRLCIYFEFAGTLGQLAKDEEAMRNIRRAVEMAEKLRADFPDVRAYRTQLVSARNNLAGALFARQPAEAEKILRRNLPLADGAWDLEGIHRCLGEVFITTRRFPEAEEAYRQALKYAEKLAAASPAATQIRSQLVHDLRRLG